MTRFRRSSWQSRFWGHVVRGVVALAMLFFLAQTAYQNFDTFFNRQLEHPATFMAFDGDRTTAAERMTNLDSEYRILASSFFIGQALSFIYPEDRRSGDITLDPSRHLPLGESRATAIFLDEGKEPYARWLRELYPGAVVHETTVSDELIRTVVYEILLSTEDIDSRRGIEGAYRTVNGSEVEVREPDLEIDWASSTPLALPFQATWRGVIKVGDYGPHELVLAVPGSARLTINGTTVAEGDRRIPVSAVLMRGANLLEIEATITHPGRVSLTNNGERVDSSAYFVHDANARGLIATFYENLDFAGEPALVQADPFVGFRYHSGADLSIGRPFSGVWAGTLEVPETGFYTFELAGHEQASMYLNGDEILTTHPGPREEVVSLPAGLHDLEVTLQNAEGTAEVYLYWTPPNGQREVIPTANLRPP